ncbi:hypothetical protein SAMN05444673_3385 [Bacillus sp. OV166]|uniref:hypothetical protein n=1 Tax=Bacillus sp. OV166 TaxID=1882763 RepID=UPI000A2AC854|nr:hypothetical protein [Bacillus sp. OV166]SMQ78358.1 hypothetical protein SAMN05444673_3385 [Bacillus sp. OV166]
MKEYKEVNVSKKIATSITCNKCGETEKITEYGFEEDKFHAFNISFGYGSMYDEEKWKFDICERCLVDFVKTFKHSPDIYEV